MSISLSFNNLSPEIAETLLETYSALVKKQPNAPVTQPITPVMQPITPITPVMQPNTSNAPVMQPNTSNAPVMQPNTPQPEVVNFNKLDSLGIPFNSKVHSDSFNKDGSWRRKRFVDQKDYDEWSKAQQPHGFPPLIDKATLQVNSWAVQPQQQYPDIPLEVFQSLINQLSQSGQLTWEMTTPILQAAGANDFEELTTNAGKRYIAYTKLCEIRDMGTH